MPATTAVRALPYPLPSEPVSAGAENIRKLAQSVDNMAQGGRVTLPEAAIGSNMDFAVVFPVPYAAVPHVIVTAITTAPDVALAMALAGSVTANGFTVRGRRVSGNSGAFDALWIAVGKTTLVA